jgi:phage tail sheath protein FI
VVEAPAVAYALSLRAAIDQSQGWHKSLSNVPLNGPTGISKDVHLDLQHPSSDATLLNVGNLTTQIRKQGFAFGAPVTTRTCEWSICWMARTLCVSAGALCTAGTAVAFDKAPHFIALIQYVTFKKSSQLSSYR